MKAEFLALAPLLAMSPVAPALAQSATPSSTYKATVDPSAFHKVPLEHKKLGVTVSPASVRLITPGVDKISIYPLLCPPHFVTEIEAMEDAPAVAFLPQSAAPAPKSAKKIKGFKP